MHANVSRGATAALLAWVALVLLACGGVLLLAVGGASAAPASDTHRAQLNTTDVVPTGDTPTATATASGGGANGTRIAPGVVLLDRSAENGSASVTLRVDSPTAVTLADGAMSDEGEIPTRTVVLEEGTHTVTLDVTDGGAVAVTITAKDTLYYVPIKSAPGADPMFSGTPGWGTVRLAGIGATLGVLLALGIEGYRRRDGGRNEVIRRA